MWSNLVRRLLVWCLFIPTLCASQSLTDEEKGMLTKGYRYDASGWIFIHIQGAPYERGFQRGYLTAREIDRAKNTVAHVMWYETGKPLDFWTGTATGLFKDKVSEEYVQEMKGIADGAAKAGYPISYDEVLLLNGSYDIFYYWWPIKKERLAEQEATGGGCSAFIATGGMTADGKIVMAHNSWCDYSTGQFYNTIVDLVPDKGHRILMQSWGPVLYSMSDFFITGAGLIGTETTIGLFKGFDSTGTPVFERARRAMQYAKTIDEWAKIMVDSNNGGYANSWLIGDLNTNEIARLELGLKHHNLEKKTDGYFAGSNIADDIQLLRDETTAPLADIRNGIVARRERWKQLMKQNKGKIDVESAKLMLADHYDTYLGRELPCFRSICAHGELDEGTFPSLGELTTPYYPAGAFDGKVVTAEMARNLQFWARWGHPCGVEFNASAFLEKRTQFDYLQGYLPDLKANPWTVFPTSDKK
ncbi:phospholipase [candidate division GN15 bacterium]|uniref:Phospholipase n=1 Tax=candidate division GN15 bacterium TaxID=2072418 RepID=A0A855X490_9BACT|nr:MAG: phospholipase [candidate division GN15 bacterium]